MKLAGMFPSPTIAFYLARLFIVRTFSILFVLVIILQSLALLSESGKILAVAGNGQPEILRYVGLRAPQIMSTFMPYSVLLGTIITLSTLNQNSEVIAMKGAGLSAHQVLAPLIVASFGVAVLSFTFNERVVSRATATLSQWQNVDYRAVPVDHGDRANVWVRDGEDLIQVGQVQGRGTAVRLSNVSLYDRDGQVLKTILSAPAGHLEGKAWRIAPVSKFDVATGRLTHLPSALIGEGVRPDQLALATVDADGLSFFALRSAISDLKDAGRPTKALEGSLWHKLSGPLSSMLMPLLGAVAAFGLARSGMLFVRAVIGMALGFTYFVSDNFALAMGNLGAYPPFLAAWAPFLLFLLIGEAVLIRSEE